MYDKLKASTEEANYDIVMTYASLPRSKIRIKAEKEYRKMSLNNKIITDIQFYKFTARGNG